MTKIARLKICAGNWKMYKTPVEALAYLQEWSQTALKLNAKVIIFPPAYNLAVFADETSIAYGPQNIYAASEGAYTGENSPATAKAMGASYVLVGHSERRTLFHETDADTAKKVNAAFEFGLTPMLCVGETLKERESGATNEVLLRQLTAGLSSLLGGKDKAPVGAPGVDVATGAHEASFVIAYEPVWAIGTGKVATPEMAEEAHKFIRATLQNMFGVGTANAVSILYGGSVKPENAAALAAQPNIDGFLVGGASLKVKDFVQIAKAL